MNFREHLTYNLRGAWHTLFSFASVLNVGLLLKERICSFMFIFRSGASNLCGHFWCYMVNNFDKKQLKKDQTSFRSKNFPLRVDALLKWLGPPEKQ